MCVSLKISLIRSAYESYDFSYNFSLKSLDYNKLWNIIYESLTQIDSWIHIDTSQTFQISDIFDQGDILNLAL